MTTPQIEHLEMADFVLLDIRNDVFIPFFPRCNPFSASRRGRKRYKNKHGDACRFLNKYGKYLFADHYGCIPYHPEKCQDYTANQSTWNISLFDNKDAFSPRDFRR